MGGPPRGGVGVPLLGGSPGTLLRMVLGQGRRLTLAGIGLGLVGALAVSSLLQQALFEVRVVGAGAARDDTDRPSDGTNGRRGPAAVSSCGADW